jgi:Uma2 family endonuclease
MIITDISQLDLTKQYSYADYLAWQIDERLEIIKGWVMRMAAPSIPHQTISMALTLEMGAFFKHHPCRFLAAPTDVCLVRKNTKNAAIKTVLQPDLLVVCDLSKIKTNRNVVGAPDLVVEILSPGNSKKEMKQKYEVYEESGVLEYWIVFPETKSVQVFVLNDNGKFIGLQPKTEDDILTSTTFPALKVDLNEVFKNV